MLKTVSDAAKFIIDTVKAQNPEEEMDEDIVVDLIEDLLREKLEDVVSPKDIQEIVDHADDEDYITAYTENRVPNYYTILDGIVKELVIDYMNTAE